MLKIYTTIVLMFSFLMLQAQDIILYKSGIEKKVKIISVNLAGNNITYKLYPTDSSSINFEESLSSVLKLKFANGTEQIINANQLGNVQNNDPNVPNNNPQRLSKPGGIALGIGIAGLATGVILTAVSFAIVPGAYYIPTLVPGVILMAGGLITTIAGGVTLHSYNISHKVALNISTKTTENFSAKISKKATPINGVSVSLNFN